MANDVQILEERTWQLLLNLSNYAKENNLSNRELAEKLGVPYNTIRGWGGVHAKKAHT